MVQLIASYAPTTEGCSVSQEQWQKEIQLEFREKPLNPAFISTSFLRGV